MRGGRNSFSKTWNSLLKEAGVISNESMSSNRKFLRHDLRRTWNVNAKEIQGLSVAERSQILGHNPVVNESHYEGITPVKILKEKAKCHPSNRLRLIVNE